MWLMVFNFVPTLVCLFFQNSLSNHYIFPIVKDVFAPFYIYLSELS